MGKTEMLAPSPEGASSKTAASGPRADGRSSDLQALPFSDFLLASASQPYWISA